MKDDLKKLLQETNDILNDTINILKKPKGDVGRVPPKPLTYNYTISEIQKENFIKLVAWKYPELAQFIKVKVNEFEPHGAHGLHCNMDAIENSMAADKFSLFLIDLQHALVKGLGDKWE